MRRLVGVLAVVAGLAGIGGTESEAARFTTRLDAVEAVLTLRAADPATPKALRKAATKGLRKLGKDTTSLAAEVKTAFAVIGPIEKKAADDAEVLGAATAAVDGLALDVGDALAAAEADVAALPAGKKPTRQKLLIQVGTAQTKFNGLVAVTGLKPKLVLLRTVVLLVAKVQKGVAQAGGGTGGPGDPGDAPCVPADDFEGIFQYFRAVAADEAVTATVADSSGTYAFEGDSVIALVGPQFPFPGAPTVFRIYVLDCEKRSAFDMVLPYPLTEGSTYTQASGAMGAYQLDYDGMFQAFPQGHSFKVVTFDEASKELVLEFSFGFVTVGRLTIHVWATRSVVLPPAPPKR